MAREHDVYARGGVIEEAGGWTRRITLMPNGDRSIVSVSPGGIVSSTTFDRKYGSNTYALDRNLDGIVDFRSETHVLDGHEYYEERRHDDADEVNDVVTSTNTDIARQTRITRVTTFFRDPQGHLVGRTTETSGSYKLGY